MAVKKLSVALDERVAAAAADEAKAQGISLSAWLNAAAERALAISAGLAAVAEVEAEIGPFSEESRAWADRVLRRDPDVLWQRPDGA